MHMINPAIASRTRLGESAHWHVATGRLLWLDLYDPAIFLRDPSVPGFIRHALPLEAPLAALVATPDPDIVIIGHRRGLSRLSISTFEITALYNPEAGRDSVGFNDMKVDRFGRLWAGSSDLAEKSPRGALWCCEPDGTISLCDAGFVVSNGPAFSPDGRTMYFVDSMSRRVLAYDLRPQRPFLTNRRVAFEIDESEGFPDGITVDAEGNIWVAHWAGARISRWTPEGQKLSQIVLPAENITSMAFGGKDFQTLYVTSAWEGSSSETLAAFPETGSVFVVATDITGLPEPLFAPRG